jgi:hypothetical protein
MMHLGERQTGHQFYKQTLARYLTEVDAVDSFAFVTDDASHKLLIEAIASEVGHPMAAKCTLQTIGTTFTYSTEKITAHMFALKNIGDPLIRCGVQDESIRADLTGFYSAFLDIIWGPAGQGGSDEEPIEVAHQNLGAARNKLRVRILSGPDQAAAGTSQCHHMLHFLTADEGGFEEEMQAIEGWRNELLAIQAKTRNDES